MRRRAFAMRFILAVALLGLFPRPSALGAPPPAAQPPPRRETRSPAELTRLRRANEEKAGKVLRKLKKAGREQRRNGSAAIKPLIGDYLAFLRLPAEERPESLSPSVVHGRIAEAISRPLNLRLLPEIRGHLDEAVKLAATPEERAVAVCDKALFALRSAEDDTPGKHQGIIRETFRGKDIPWKRRLEMIRSAVASGLLGDVGFEEVAWESVADEPEAHAAFYDMAIRNVKARDRQKYNRLRADCSPEHIVAICDRALADPAVREKKGFVVAQSEAFVEMRRPDRAEQLLLDLCATTDASLRYEGSMALGQFYTKRARRYHAAPEPGCLRKAALAFSNASLARPEAPGPFVRLGEISLELGEYDRALQAFEEVVSRGGRTNAPSAIGLGDAHYGKRDWEAAVRCYGLYPEQLDAETTLRYCRSLFILGRYEETAEGLERFERLARGRDAKDEARTFLSEVRKRIPPEGGRPR